MLLGEERQVILETEEDKVEDVSWFKDLFNDEEAARETKEAERIHLLSLEHIKQQADNFFGEKLKQL